MSRMSPGFFVLEKDTTQRLEFQTFPSSLSWSAAATYASETIIGRSEPVRVYSHSEAMSLNLTLAFVGSISSEDDSTPPSVSQVTERLLWLKNLTLPRYQNSIMSPPHTFFLILGNYILTRCLLLNVSVDHPDETFWSVSEGESGSEYTFYPQYAVATLQLQEVNEKPLGFDDYDGGLSIGGALYNPASSIFGALG